MELIRKRDKLAIVGFCSPHRDWAPYTDPEWDCWGLNRGYIFMEAYRKPAADMWFDMHGRAIWEWQQRRPGNHVQWLQSFPGPIVMHEAVPDVIPNSIAYPFEEVAADIGRGIFRFAPEGGPENLGKNQPQSDMPYLASSIAQQIALGIWMGYQEIGLWGIDLNTTSEYAWQKPGVEHMLGLAGGRGIKIHLPDMCPLLRGGIYGRGYMRPEGETMTLAQVSERLDALQAEHEAFVREFNLMQGAKREIEDFVKAQMLPGIDHELVERRLKNINQAINQWQIKVIQVEGALNETLYWAHITPDGQDPAEAMRELRLKRLGETGQSDGPEEGSLEVMLSDMPSSDKPVPTVNGAVPEMVHA